MVSATPHVTAQGSASAEPEDAKNTPRDEQRQLLRMIERDDYIGIGDLQQVAQFEKPFINSQALDAFHSRSKAIKRLAFRALHEDDRAVVLISRFLSDQQKDELRPLVQRHLETLELLLSMGLDPNAEPSDYWGPLYQASLDLFWDLYTNYGILELESVENLAKIFVEIGIDLLKKDETDDSYPIYWLDGVDKIIYPEMYRQIQAKGLPLDLDLGEGNTLLMLSASDNNVELVEQLISGGANPLLKNSDDLNALELVNSDVFIVPTPPEAAEASVLILRQMVKTALQTGDSEVLTQPLYSFDFEIDSVPDSGTLPMMVLASYLDEPEIIQGLLGFGLDPNTAQYIDWAGNFQTAYPLFIAAQEGSIKAFNALAASDKSDVQIVDAEGRHLLHVAVSSEKEALLARAIQLAPGLINLPDKSGRLPVQYLFESFHDEEIIRALGPVLFRPPFDPNVVIKKQQTLGNKEFIDSYTPLGRAIKGDIFRLGEGYEPLIHALLALPALDVNLADANGVTPLMLAAEFAPEDLFKRLIEEYGADFLTASDRHGKTVLFYLLRATTEKPESVHYLMNKLDEATRKEYINRVSSAKRSAVFETLADLEAGLKGRSKTNTQLIHILNEYGADFNLRDINGETITMRALKLQQLDGLRALAGVGAPFSPYLKNVRGDYPLAFAVRRSFPLDYVELIFRQDVYRDSQVRDLLESATEPRSRELWTLHHKISDEHSLRSTLLVEDFEKARTLLLSGVSPNAALEEGQTHLMKSLERGKDRAVFFLLSLPELDLRIVDYAGRTHLDYAQASEHQNFINAVRSRYTQDFFRALDVKDLKSLEIFLEQAVDINQARDTEGRTALMSAMESEDLSGFYYLLGRPDLGVDQEHQNGESLSSFALEVGKPEILNALIDRFPKAQDLFDPEIASRRKLIERWFALIQAGDVQDVRSFLLEHPIDVTTKDAEGRTAFEIAYEDSNQQLVDLLAERLSRRHKLQAWFLKTHSYLWTMLGILALATAVLLAHAHISRQLQKLNNTNSNVRTQAILRLTDVLSLVRLTEKLQSIPILSLILTLVIQVGRRDEILQALQEVRTDSSLNNRILVQKAIDGFRTSDILYKDLSSLPEEISISYSLSSEVNEKPYYETFVSSKEHKIKILEFGAFVHHQDRWVLSNPTGKSFVSRDFELRYSCPDAVLEPGTEYRYKQPFPGTENSPSADLLLYFIGEGDKGNRVKGTKVIQDSAGGQA